MTTKKILTAAAILRVLKDGGPIEAEDFRRQVADLGGFPNWIGAASKHLRNTGVPVFATKARHRSQWRIDVDPKMAERWHKRQVQESYSQTVSTARALSLCKGTGFKRIHNKVLLSALSLGDALGYDTDDVIAECKTVPDDVAAVLKDSA